MFLFSERIYLVSLMSTTKLKLACETSRKTTLIHGVIEFRGLS